MVTCGAPGTFRGACRNETFADPFIHVQAKRDDVQKAWSELAKEHGLTQKELIDVDRVFGFLDGTLCR
jgi:hypothetical protein